MSQISHDGKQSGMDESLLGPAEWGLSVSQLKAFYEWCKDQPGWRIEMSVREFVECVIIPSYESGRGVALSIPENTETPKCVRWLISHSWEEAAAQFFEDVLAMAEECTKSFPMRDDEGIFICFLSLFQGTDEELQLQVTQGSDDVNQGCFARVLQSIKDRKGGIWIIPNENLAANGQGLYSRLWCGWEAYNAKKENVRILLPPWRCTPRHIFGDVDISCYTLEAGSCGNPRHQKEADMKNQALIRAAVEREGGWTKVDRAIIRLMIRTIQAPDFVAQFLDSDDRAISDTALLALGALSLPDAPESEAALKHVESVADLLGIRSGAILALQRMGQVGCVAATRRLFNQSAATRRAALDVIKVFTEQAEHSLETEEKSPSFDFGTLRAYRPRSRMNSLTDPDTSISLCSPTSFKSNDSPLKATRDKDDTSKSSADGSRGAHSETVPRFFISPTASIMTDVRTRATGGMLEAPVADAADDSYACSTGEVRSADRSIPQKLFTSTTPTHKAPRWSCPPRLSLKVEETAHNQALDESAHLREQTVTSKPSPHVKVGAQVLVPRSSGIRTLALVVSINTTTGIATVQFMEGGQVKVKDVPSIFLLTQQSSGDACLPKTSG